MADIRHLHAAIQQQRQELFVQKFYETLSCVRHSSVKRIRDSDGQTLSSSEITEFLQNPQKWIIDGFLLTKHLDSQAEDSAENEDEASLSSKIHERLLTWTIFVKDSEKEIASAQLAGYFDGAEVVIESFWVNPEKQGHGRRIIEWLHNLMAEKSIRLSVSQDQTDEGQGFWSKMYKLGFVQ